MSLDTVLNIGKALRNSPDNLQHFKYVSPCPKDKEGNYSPLAVSIPVNTQYEIEWDNISLVPENETLFYLRFKTSDSDSFVKYIFGDIYYEKESKISKDNTVVNKERGYFRLGNPDSKPAYQKNSFFRGKADFNGITKSYEGIVLKNFHIQLEQDIEILEKVLNNISGVQAYLEERPSIRFSKYLENNEMLSKFSVRKIYDKTGSKNLKRLNIESDINQLTEKEKRTLLQYDHGEIFVHFKFLGNKHWYDYTAELELITNKMLSDFIESTNYGFVLKKTLYKTLCSGDKKNDWQFPNFSPTDKYKSYKFNEEDILDLFYAIDYASKGRTISGTDIKIIILPKGNDLSAKDYESFSKVRDEERIKKPSKEIENNGEPLFDDFEKDNEDSIISFDVIFCKKGGTSSPDVDLIEISGLEKSQIRRTKERLESISEELSDKRKKALRTTKDLFPFKLEFCFRNVLGSPQFDQKSNKVSFKANPKYKSHMLKILPQIYTESYFDDSILLPAFIQNIEYSIRSGDDKFNFLKFDLEYLFRIQNSSIDKFNIMINSKSYQIGKQLGQLAKPLGKAINSFEKSYVGLITRRVATREDCIKFINEIEEKRTRHGIKWAGMSADTIGKIATIPLKDYNKEHIAFGFFEGYFTYEEKGTDPKKFYTRLEKLINDFSKNTELENTIQKISSIIDNSNLN